MSQSTSPSCQRPYGLALVCRAWKASRATLYRQRRTSQRQGASPGRRGPRGAGSDAELLKHIRATLAASPFTGEGYRKVWARLRLQGVRTAARRVLRIMGENRFCQRSRPRPGDIGQRTGFTLRRGFSRQYRYAFGMSCAPQLAWLQDANFYQNAEDGELHRRLSRSGRRKQKLQIPSSARSGF